MTTMQTCRTLPPLRFPHLFPDSISLRSSFPARARLRLLATIVCYPFARSLKFGKSFIFNKFGFTAKPSLNERAHMK
uniref:Uncharacterized protein n=1 Tax=Cucumis sativus TaxID=3659 RepID=A0A0A0KPH1_CUCSA